MASVGGDLASYLEPLESQQYEKFNNQIQFFFIFSSFSNILLVKILKNCKI